MYWHTCTYIDSYVGMYAVLHATTYTWEGQPLHTSACAVVAESNPSLISSVRMCVLPLSVVSLLNHFTSPSSLRMCICMYVCMYVRMCHLRASNLCVRWCEQHCSKETETDLEAHERLQGHGCRGYYCEYESLHRGCEMWSMYVHMYVVYKQVCSVWWPANVDSFHSTTKLVGVMMEALLQYMRLYVCAKSGPSSLYCSPCFLRRAILLTAQPTTTSPTRRRMGRRLFWW